MRKPRATRPMRRDSARCVVWAPFAAGRHARPIFYLPSLGSPPGVGILRRIYRPNAPGPSDILHCIAPPMETSSEDRRDEADGVLANKRRKRGRQAKSCVACHRRKQKVRSSDVIYFYRVERTLNVRSAMESCHASIARGEMLRLPARILKRLRRIDGKLHSLHPLVGEVIVQRHH